MKKNLLQSRTDVSYVSMLNSKNSQIQKYVALERHPRQKQEPTSYFNQATSVVSLML